VPRWGYGFGAEWSGQGGGNVVPHRRYWSGPAWALPAFFGLGSAYSVRPGRCCRSSGGAAMVQIFQLGQQWSEIFWFQRGRSSTSTDRDLGVFLFFRRKKLEDVR
jgi:hypothetical protein